MGMTSNLEKIEELTSLSVGKVFFGDQGYTPCMRAGKNNEGIVLDPKSRNFHLIPEIFIDGKEENEVDGSIVDISKKYQDYIVMVRENVDELLKTEPAVINGEYSVGGSGKPGTITGIPYGYKDNRINGFIRFIQLKSKDGSFFTLNFNRFYIENKTVNCRFGEIQFDYSEDKKGNVNKNRINYPDTYEAQKLDAIDFVHGEAAGERALVYNPPVSSIKDICEKNLEPDLVRSFMEFIKKVEDIKSR